MSKDSISSKVLWRSQPWIMPKAVSYTILSAVVVGALAWVESVLNVANYGFFDVSVVLWTMIGGFGIWSLSLARLLIYRASHVYVLRTDGLEITKGLIGKRTLTIAPAGFSDLEVARSVSQRLQNTGDIVIRTESENIVEMNGVKNPVRVSEMVKKVLSRPVFRLDSQQAIERTAQVH